MLKWPSLMPPRAALGLDIGPSAVKLVELVRTRNGALSVSRLGQVALGEGSIVDGQIEKFDPVADAVRDLVRRVGVRSRRVVMALPNKNVILRRVRFRADMSEEELAVHVESEAAGFVPFPVEDLALDFAVVGPAPGSASESEVLIAAARRDRVQDRLAVAEAAGLEPVVVETESTALQLALQAWQRRSGRNPKAEIIGLVELGHEAMGLKVFFDDDVLFEREQGWGARRLLERTARELGMTEAQVRDRQSLGDLPAGYHTQILPDHVSQTAAELDRMLQFYYAAAPGKRLSALVLAGGAASLAGLVARVAEVTGLPVSTIDPFEHMVMGAEVDAQALGARAPTYLLACGLALRSFQA